MAKSIRAACIVVVTRAGPAAIEGFAESLQQKVEDPRPKTVPYIEVVSKRTIAYKPQGHSIITTSA